MIKQGNAPFYSFSLHTCADYLGMRVGEGRVERGIALFIYLSKALRGTRDAEAQHHFRRAERRLISERGEAFP